MSGKLIRGLLFLAYFIVAPNISFSQQDDKFLDYLSKNKLKREHEAYLQEINLKSGGDENYWYYRSKYYYQYPNDSLLIKSIKQSDLFCKDSCASFLTGVYFLKNPSSFTNEWFNNSTPYLTGKGNEQLKKIYSAGQNPSTYNANEFVEPIQLSFNKLKKYHKKKPFIAGLLSTLIPGAGKLYNGQYSSFFTTFLTHAVLGLQIYEGIKIREIKSGLSIFNIGFTSLLYFGNIYGSYKSVKQKKKELRNQFYINAASYYTNNNFCEH